MKKAFFQNSILCFMLLGCNCTKNKQNNSHTCNKKVYASNEKMIDSTPICIKAFNENKERLVNKKTANADVNKIIASGMANPDSSIGCYAADQNSYKEFNDIFDEVVSKYHSTNKHKQNKINNLNLIEDFSQKAKSKIVSTRVRFARNSKSYPFPSAITNKQRNELEAKFIKTIKSTPFFYKLGKYESLANMSEDRRLKLIKEHLLFKDISKDKYLAAAGISNDYPNGRGIYISKNKDIIIWLNEEDQFRIISLNHGSDIKSVLNKLLMAEKELKKSFEFAYSDKLGYLNSCPTNIGTGMRASVHIKLPKLSSKLPMLKELARSMNLDIRGIDGEHSESPDGTVDVSNKERLGKSEIELINNLVKGVNALASIEELFNN